MTGSSKSSATPSAQRTRVFVSYSHKDKKFLDEFKTMLAPVKDLIDLWDDTMIKPGAKWLKEIEKALAAARVGVLLVSDSFFASPFITKKEVPELLKAAKEAGATIFWVRLTPSLVGRSEIKEYQAAHDISKPLDQLSKAKRKAVWEEICKKLLDILENP